MFDPYVIKKDFPLLQSQKDLVYLDSTATSLKPYSVIRSLRAYYEEYSANIYRGIYKMSEIATVEYEKTRGVIAQLIHAKSSDEIIFTRNTTESLNLIMYALGERIIGKGDEIVTTIMEHHSNFVPWQQLAIKKKAKFKIINLDKHGNLDVKGDLLEKYITKKTKILTLTYISNVLGVVNDVKSIIAKAKRINPHIITIIDGAQAVPHREVNVLDLGVDFFAFSGHKMLGPTGVGVLWGKKEFLQTMNPFLYGGEMINEVYTDKTIFKESPFKYEAGTPAIAEVIALKEAAYYLKKIGLTHIEEHESKLATLAVKRLKEEFKDIFIVGSGIKKRAGIVSFHFEKYHPHDIAQILSERNVCVRAGNHCAMPLHQYFNIGATVRASFYLYNTQEDVEKLIDGVARLLKILG